MSKLSTALALPFLVVLLSVCGGSRQESPSPAHEGGGEGGHHQDGRPPTQEATAPVGEHVSVCHEIGQACHGADHAAEPGSEAGALIHECHASAHTTWSEEECVARRSACLDACAAVTSAHD